MSIPMVMVDSLSREECLALLEISHTINSTLDIQKILNSTLQQLSRVIEASASSIWLSSHLSNPKRRRKPYLHVAAATGEKSDEIQGVVLDRGQGIVGQVVNQGQASSV